MEFVSESLHTTVDLGRLQHHESPYPAHSSAINSNVMIYYRTSYTEMRASEFASLPAAALYPSSFGLPDRSQYPDVDGGRNDFASAGADNSGNALLFKHLYDRGADAINFPIYLSDASQFPPVLPSSLPESYPPPYLPLNQHELVQQAVDYSYANHYQSAASTSHQHASTTHQSSESKDALNVPATTSDGKEKTRKRRHSSMAATGNVEQTAAAQDTMPSCSVCGDDSSGVHYGIWACEGCKGFFRRAMARKPTEPPFSCYNSLDCDINRENRTKCRACRFRRCQEVGMSYGGIKEGRRRRNSNSIHSGSGVDLHMPVELQWKESILAAHMDTFAPVSEVFMSRYASVVAASPEDLWPIGSDIGKRGFHTIHLFSKSLPFFSCIPADLRDRMVEANALDVMILRAAYRFCPERDAFIFPPGHEVTLSCLQSTQLGSTVTIRLASLGRAMIRLGVGSEELAFLTTLAILSVDNVIVGESVQANLLREIENNVLKSFQQYMHQRWSSRPALMGKLVMLLLDARVLQFSASSNVWMEPQTGSLLTQANHASS